MASTEYSLIAIAAAVAMDIGISAVKSFHGYPGTPIIRYTQFLTALLAGREMIDWQRCLN